MSLPYARTTAEGVCPTARPLPTAALRPGPWWRQLQPVALRARRCGACGRRGRGDARPPGGQVLRIDKAGKTRRIYVKRRDLLRANGLQPRDLRRIDPSLSLTKTAPNITVKEDVLLINLGGVRCAAAAARPPRCRRHGSTAAAGLHGSCTAQAE